MEIIQLFWVTFWELSPTFIGEYFKTIQDELFVFPQKPSRIPMRPGKKLIDLPMIPEKSHSLLSTKVHTSHRIDWPLPSLFLSTANMMMARGFSFCFCRDSTQHTDIWKSRHRWEFQWLCGVECSWATGAHWLPLSSVEFICLLDSGGLRAVQRQPYVVHCFFSPLFYRALNWISCIFHRQKHTELLWLLGDSITLSHFWYTVSTR